MNILCLDLTNSFQLFSLHNPVIVYVDEVLIVAITDYSQLGQMQGKFQMVFGRHTGHAIQVYMTP
ncbi:uncharacterized protein J3R85_015009 [Psidium guajava]|nr:uncharacterized protein J3R85_015009 [Psidium guajava]